MSTPTDSNPNKKKDGGKRPPYRNNRRGGPQNKKRRNGKPGQQGEQTNSKPPPKREDSTASKPSSNESKVTQTAHITDKNFGDLPIAANSKRAMEEVFKYQFMTVVQAETLPVILKGQDCLARAKTGTGKTLAFLIPAVEVLLRSERKAKDDIECLVLSPTRELAFQIQTEAESLTKFHSNLKAVAFVGGTNIAKDQRALKQTINILVATPGRLLDHLQNGGIAQRFHNMKVLVFDECDQLLDQGFRPDIERILRLLDPSRSTRQTLLFSATVPESVSEIASIALKPEYTFIDTVGEDEEQTHLHVQQDLYVTSQEQQLHAVESLLAQETASGNPYKIIVFFTTARLTGFAADLFNSVEKSLGYSVLQIHSRKSQAARQKASDKFRDSKNGILFSSDVSARGLDYPDVTFVLQIGLTERSQYIHRLGRTARAGKEGRGALLVAPYEEKWMRKELSDMPLNNCPVPERLAHSTLDGALKNVPRDKELKMSGEQCYRAWLGFYNGHLKKVGWNKNTLVTQANQFAKDIGLSEQPALLRKTIGKMGLKGVQGLKIE